MKIPFAPGINQRVVENLKKVTKKLSNAEKYCCILFDEMSIQPGLHYNKYKDVLEGFVTYGEEKYCRLADHALVFMIQGIFRKWKQPLAFMFSEGSVSSAQLAVLIKKIVRKLLYCGLNPIACVCDQGSSNRAAINSLIAESKANYAAKNIDHNIFGFEVDNHEVVPLFDYPHLIKCIRNNLLTKYLLYTYKGRESTASWQHIVTIYKWDTPTKYFSHFTKLTDAHVLPEKINKMKVKCCTQVFSQSLGKLMLMLTDAGKNCVLNK